MLTAAAEAAVVPAGTQTTGFLPIASNAIVDFYYGGSSSSETLTLNSNEGSWTEHDSHVRNIANTMDAKVDLSGVFGSFSVINGTGSSLWNSISGATASGVSVLWQYVDPATTSVVAFSDYIRVWFEDGSDADWNDLTGIFHVTGFVTPIPAAVWMMGSGLAAMAGFSRLRRRRTPAAAA